jgi:hypothetical protein
MASHRDDLGSVADGDHVIQHADHAREERPRAAGSRRADRTVPTTWRDAEEWCVKPPPKLMKSDEVIGEAVGDRRRMLRSLLQRTAPGAELPLPSHRSAQDARHRAGTHLIASRPQRSPDALQVHVGVGDGVMLHKELDGQWCSPGQLGGRHRRRLCRPDHRSPRPGHCRSRPAHRVGH